jgi:hypothetical protein
MSISALKTSLFTVSVVFFMGIATASPAQAKPAPPTPIDIKKVELGGRPWNPQLGFGLCQRARLSHGCQEPDGWEDEDG